MEADWLPFRRSSSWDFTSPLTPHLLKGFCFLLIWILPSCIIVCAPPPLRSSSTATNQQSTFFLGVFLRASQWKSPIWRISQWFPTPELEHQSHHKLQMQSQSCPSETMAAVMMCKTSAVWTLKEVLVLSPKFLSSSSGSLPCQTMKNSISALQCKAPKDILLSLCEQGWHPSVNWY